MHVVINVEIGSVGKETVREIKIMARRLRLNSVYV